MPTKADRLFRDFVRYTGDGLPGEPANAPLPVGDPGSGGYNPTKKDMRDVFREAFAAFSAAQASASGLQNVMLMSTRADAVADVPVTSPDLYRVAGYASVGDGGAALYRRVSSQPSHAGRFQNGNGHWYELSEAAPVPEMFGAPATGNADAAFAALETYKTGLRLDLGGRTYEVASVPTGNAYANAFWSVDGITRSSIVLGELGEAPASVVRYGGQLAALHRAILDPLQQEVGIAFIGDSITWGRTLPENGAFDPRDGTLSDPRDMYASASWVNEVKRWIGATFFPDSAPTLGNWSAAPSGQSTATFTRNLTVFPAAPDFAIAHVGPSISDEVLYNSAYVTGAQMRLGDGNAGDTSYHTITFKFTGRQFGVMFGSGISQGLDYQVRVNGALIGTWGTQKGDPGAPDDFNTRMHTLSGFVRDATIEIRTKRKTGSTGTHALYLYGLTFPKRVRLTNQGINGATTRSYWSFNINGSSFGDGVAVGSDDSFAFVQLGTNDRGRTTTMSYSLSESRGYLTQIVDAISGLGVKPILMAANAVTGDGPNATFHSSMSEVRNMVEGIASAKSVDFVDNLQPFIRPDLPRLLADGLHPNRMGHALIARNVINAIRSA